ncbi:hypothetical protein HPB48_006597 [Haemaphysalis longicornis]|uniref:Exosome complex component 10 homolog n=1 Tax=Haemaphysalis longicornis TaxID=44386 RepID=A0A9J6GPE6_HAELO|nr:hypothetical protein HPB48_006597 [Haemaphysalis longicornis]
MSSEEQVHDAQSSVSRFLGLYDDSNKYAEHVLRSVVQATKAANDLPSAGEDFEYFSSFASFRQVMLAEGKNVLKMMTSLAGHQVGKGRFEGLDLEEKFDLLADVNDSVLERVGNSLDEATGMKKNPDDVVVMNVNLNRTIHTSWNKKASIQLGSNVHLLAAKNVVRPQLSFRDKVDNSNTPFVPVLKDKPHSLKPLALLPERAADGSESYGHPYEWEIDHFQPSKEQLEAPTEKRWPPPLDETPFTLVETVEQLQEMCAALSQEVEIAVDLEHHSYRSFQGFTCLMQISTRSHDYIVDTLALRHELHVLNDVFANPKILKVLHGAEMDVQWLQRDFGLYLVGLFDTGQAARVLGLAHFSLAFLLRHYCQIEADKQFQLADWRIRPLPPEMVRYARGDTHYLLHVMDCMKRELVDRSNETANLLRSVFDRSKQVCLRRYEKPSYHEQSYLELYRKSRKSFNGRQLYALCHLYTWRDKIARLEDESTGYVLPNHMILEISEILPREQQGIVACCNPCPPLVRQNLNELHRIILKAREMPLNQKNPVLEESSWPVAAQLDLDSVLHSVHDRPRHDDASLSLPTLLDEEAEPVPTEKRKKLRAVRKPKPSMEPMATKVLHLQLRAGTLDLPYKRYKAAVERDGPDVDSSQRDPDDVAPGLDAKSRRNKRKKPEPDVGLLPDGKMYDSPGTKPEPVEVKADSEEEEKGASSFQPFDYESQQQSPAAGKKGRKRPAASFDPEQPESMKAAKRKRRRANAKSRTFGSQGGAPAAKWPKR